MTPINMSEICSATPTEIIEWSNNTTTIPALLILFVLSVSSFLGIGLALAKNKAKYLSIWIFSFILSAIVLVILILAPNTVQNFVEWIKNIFN